MNDFDGLMELYLEKCSEVERLKRKVKIQDSMIKNLEEQNGELANNWLSEMSMNLEREIRKHSGKEDRI